MEDWKQRKKQKKMSKRPIRTFADLFCGAGGFHWAAAERGLRCVWACDIDKHARRTYLENFGVYPEGDLFQVWEHRLPDFDLLFGGFPCQPFSNSGKRRGFADEGRGNLFFEILRLLKAKRPRGFVLENVVGLMTIDGGDAFRRVISELRALEYSVGWRVLDLRNFGIPQARRRVIICGVDDLEVHININSPDKPMAPLKDFLEANPHPRSWLTDSAKARVLKTHKAPRSPMFWYRDWSTHTWTSLDHANTLTTMMNHDSLIDGVRAVDPRERFRLQGFPEHHKIIDNYAHAYKQAGNAIPPQFAGAGIDAVLRCLPKVEKHVPKDDGQAEIFGASGLPGEFRLAA